MSDRTPGPESEPPALRPGMAPEAFRDEARRLLALTLSRWVLTEGERRLLRALDTHFRTADAAALSAVADLL